MEIFVYRSSRRAETYIYLPRKEDFSDLPEGLTRALGALEFALSFDLTPERRLARVDAGQVQQRLRDDGYFIQHPPAVDDFESLYDPDSGPIAGR